MKPVKDPSTLACIYLLIPTLVRAHRYDRAGVFRLTDADIGRLTSRAAQLPLNCEPLGRRGAQIDATGISMRDLCLLHARDAQPVSQRSRFDSEFLNAQGPLSWMDLQTVLRAQPELGLLDHLRERLTPEQYDFGIAAVKYIEEHRDAVVAGIFPDIYSAIWSMEKALATGTIFRGQFRAEWGLESTLLRPNTDGILDVAQLLERIEQTSDFISVVRQHSTELFDKQIDEDCLLAVAQHFGFPTSLLDFTESLRVAAFFATQSAACLDAAEPPIGVIYYIAGPDQRHAQLESTKASRLSQWVGVRPGSLHVIRPDLPDSDDRIRRQQGVFIAGYRARHLQAVTIDRIHFRQHPGLIFEDPRSGISREQLLPGLTTLSRLAEESRGRKRAPAAMSDVLRHTPLSDSNVIGSADAHLYWHLRSGDEYMSALKERAVRMAGTPVYQAFENTLNQFFAMARVEAEVSACPDHTQAAAWTPLIRKTISALEEAAGLSDGKIWNLVQEQLPKGFAHGGQVRFDLPEDWSENAHLAFSCALFCIAWEHLRCVPGERARELVQSADMYLRRFC